MFNLLKKIQPNLVSSYTNSKFKNVVLTNSHPANIGSAEKSSCDLDPIFESQFYNGEASKTYSVSDYFDKVFNVGYNFFRNGEHTKSDAAFNHAIEIFEFRFSSIDFTPYKGCEILIKHSKNLLELDLLDEAKAALVRAMELNQILILNNCSVTAIKIGLEIKVMLAKTHRKLGDFQDALEYYDVVIIESKALKGLMPSNSSFVISAYLGAAKCFTALGMKIEGDIMIEEASNILNNSISASAKLQLLQ